MLYIVTRRCLLRPSATAAALSQRCFVSRTATLYSNDHLPYHLVVGLPALSPTMNQGTLSEWYVKEGDKFTAGDAIAKIETDKAAMDFEAQDDGVVAKILIKAGEGDDLDVGTPIMVTVEDAADVAAFANFSAPKMAVVAAVEAPAVVVPKPAAAAAAALPTTTEPPKVVVVAPRVEPVKKAPPAAVPVAATTTTTTAPTSVLLTTSPLAKRMAKQQLAYTELYGTTGYKPIVVGQST